MFNFEQGELSAAECMEGLRRVMEAVHPKLRRATIIINEAVDVSKSYNQV